MTTNEVIKALQFNNFYHIPLQFLQNGIHAISTWQLHTNSLPRTIIFSFVLVVVAILIRRIFIIKNNLKQKAILLEITPPAFTEKTAYTTKQLFSVIHNSRSGNRILNWLLGRITIFSFEIVSTREKGIRYLIRTSPEQKENMKRKIVSYMPYIKVKEVDEYITDKKNSRLFSKVIEFKLKSRFAYPLEKQNVLNQHDPVAYITGMMTQLTTSELISFQLVISPTRTRETQIISQKILRQDAVLPYLDRPQYPGIINVLTIMGSILAKVISKMCMETIDILSKLSHPETTQPAYAYNYSEMQRQLKAARMKPVQQLSSFEQDVIQSVQEKIDQPLFETSIRVYVSVKNKQELNDRINGLKSSLEPFAVPQYQSLQAKFNFPPFLIAKIRNLTFRKRLLSLVNNKSTSLLSVSEVADLYHFPYSRVTQTENIVKLHSRELPAPLSLKNGRELDVIFANNTYGGTVTPIGLTEEERLTHMYVIGRTGSGKTNMMFTMAKQDIENGHGLAFIDPHGSVSEDLLATIPLSRKDDIIYVNPIDLKHPIGINILELTPGLSEDDAELEKEVVAEGVVSLFRKVFAKDDNANAHRIEHILRNTIYTAFTVEGCTIFTINKLLTNPTFRKQVTAKLKDEDLVDFWKYEFGKAGDFQVVKMTQGVTAKVGRFLRSPTAKRMLEQEKSTINFDDIINSGKILICNFSQGKLGEDTSRLMGTTIMTKLQQAALKREYIPEHKRRIFYLYVDEFQNFATQSFTKMVTENRKYRMPLIIAEQSSSQQKDHDITNIILANVTTVITFRSGNYVDEDLMLNQFAPYLQKGDIMNLPRFHFFIKISAIESEEPFSGETIFKKVKKDLKKIIILIQASQKNWTIVYNKLKPKEEKTVVKTQPKEVEKKPETVLTGSGLPKRNRK